MKATAGCLGALPSFNVASVIELSDHALSAVPCFVLSGFPWCAGMSSDIDWLEDRFDTIGGDYDTATSGDAAGRTRRVGNVVAPCQRERPSPVSARRCWATDKSRSFCSSKSCSSKSSNSRQMIRFSVAIPRIGSPAEARSWWRRSRLAAASANRWWSEKVRASFTCLYSASVAHPGLAAFQCESIACV